MSLRRFASRGPIGLDVSPRWLAAAQVAGPARHPRLVAAVCLPRARAGAPDAAELERFARVLDRHGFRGSRVVTAAPDDGLMAAVLELPPRRSGAPVEQLARAEMARSHRLEPESFELALLDVPAQGRAGDGGHYMALGLPRDCGEGTVRSFEDAGLVVHAIDARAWAMARACAPAGAGSGLSALLDLGESAAVLVLVRSGVVTYQRTVPEAGLSAVRKRMTSLLGLPTGIVEYFLGDTAALADAVPEQAGGIIDDYVQAIAGETRAAIDYVARRSGGAVVDRLLVMGAGTRTPGVLTRLSASLGMEARPVSPSDAVEAPGELGAACSDARLTVAAGLAMYEEKCPGSVNLIPAPRRLARARRARVTTWAVVCVVYAAGLLTAFVVMASRGAAERRDWESEVSRVNQETTVLTDRLTLVRSDLAREESARRAAAAVEGQPDWSKLFALLARCAGGEIWIENVSLKPAASTPTGSLKPATRETPALRLAITGLGESHEAVSAFVLGLEGTGLFLRVTQQEMIRQQWNAREVIKFRIECTLETGP